MCGHHRAGQTDNLMTGNKSFESVADFIYLEMTERRSYSGTG